MAAFRASGLLGFLTLVFLASITRAQEPPRDCINTGLTCIEDCAGLPDGNYQWCGSCHWFVQCTVRVTYYQQCPGSLYWDDNVKACASTTSTCEECVTHTSPSGQTETPRTTVIAGQCDTTGPDCIDHCDQTTNGVYQWCARCDFFLLCSGSDTYYQACQPGLDYDHTVQACVYNSTTCFDNPCYGEIASTTTNANPCSSAPCLNQGTCTPGGGGYICTCPPNYTGPRCQTPIIGPENPCDSSPCLNGGTCVQTDDGYTCTCHVDWTGLICESPNYNQNMTCGTELEWSGYPAANGFTRFCYHWVPLTDTAGRTRECHDTIQGIPLYTDADGLMAAGGNFGCIVSNNYPDDLPGTSSLGCQDDYQQDVSLGDAIEAARLMICLRYPYEGIPRKLQKNRN